MFEVISCLELATEYKELTIIILIIILMICSLGVGGYAFLNVMIPVRPL